MHASIDISTRTSAQDRERERDVERERESDRGSVYMHGIHVVLYGQNPPMTSRLTGPSLAS